MPKPIDAMSSFQARLYTSMSANNAQKGGLKLAITNRSPAMTH